MAKKRKPIAKFVMPQSGGKFKIITQEVIAREVDDKILTKSIFLGPAGRQKSIGN